MKRLKQLQTEEFAFTTSEDEDVRIEKLKKKLRLTQINTDEDETDIIFRKVRGSFSSQDSDTDADRDGEFFHFINNFFVRIKKLIFLYLYTDSIRKRHKRVRSQRASDSSPEGSEKELSLDNCKLFNKL